VLAKWPTTLVNCSGKPIHPSKGDISTLYLTD
jgi:hypothetical protein